MKFIILLSSLIFLRISAVAQTTSIPDNNFEQELIDLGVDDTLDGEVLTESIDTISILAVPSLEIADLTGIADFTALQELICFNNELTSLDLSSNTNIKLVNCSINNLMDININNCVEIQALICSDNALTEIDLSENTSLITLNIAQNELSSLDMSANISLMYLYCAENGLTDINVSDLYVLDVIACQNNGLVYLDLSTNISLTQCFCQFNQLINLDLKNGNNISICSDCFSCFNNTDLDCVQVDDPDYSTDNWPNHNDHTSFNYECNLSIDKSPSSAFNIYPNPANDILYIDVTEKRITYQIYSVTGEHMQTGTLTKGTNLIPVDALSPGFYTLQLSGYNFNSIIKMVIQ
jgi:hypothetical protein